jgi:alpha-L-fucosidase
LVRLCCSKRLSYCSLHFAQVTVHTMVLCNQICLFFWGIVLCAVCYVIAQPYQPNWKSLDSRPIPPWYDQAKFGIFIHWGVFSVPAFACDNLFSAEWYEWAVWGDKVPCAVQFHNRVYPNMAYADFAPMFRAELFDPDAWAETFVKAGARYVVFTTKHHDGFCNWPSSVSWNWNSVDIGPHRNNVRDLVNAFRRHGLHVGLYFSLFEWFNPLYLADKRVNGTTQVYVNTTVLPQLYDIVNTFHPELIFSDGDWEMTPEYWQSKEFLSWLYNYSPVKDVVVVNDRWGIGAACHHGGYWTCYDRYNPGVLQSHKWENAFTIDANSWGLNRASNMSSYLSIEDILYQLVSSVATNGNILMNVGPAADGTIPPIYEERLLQIGQWLRTNGEAIYATRPWSKAQNQTDRIWYTSKGSVVYAIALDWPVQKLHLNAPTPTSQTQIILLGYNVPLKYSNESGGLTIQLSPFLSPAQLPVGWAWTFKLLNVH